MRLCANENLPRDCVTALQLAGHDVLWIRKAMPGAGDEVVLARARVEKRLLLTFDRDFGALVFQRGKAAAAGVVLFRIRPSSAPAVASAVTRILASRNDWSGHFSVVDDRTVRMRALP